MTHGMVIFFKKPKIEMKMGLKSSVQQSLEIQWISCMIHSGQAGAFSYGDVHILYRKKLECGILIKTKLQVIVFTLFIRSDGQRGSHLIFQALK